VDFFNNHQGQFVNDGRTMPFYGGIGGFLAIRHPPLTIGNTDPT
jgi:hypothetical protein